MELTLAQGIILTVVAFLFGVDFWLEGFFIFRPIIVSTITGLIIGDLKLGIIAGGLCELSFSGLTPAGGTQPPNPVLAGVMTVVLAHTTGSTPAKAIGLALPFSFLMQYVILFFYSAFSGFMPKIDKLAEEGDTKNFAKYPILMTLIVGVSYSVVVFLSAYAAQGPMRVFVANFPEWLSHGLQVAGGVLPAIGFGMLLKTMLKTKYIPYLIIGFVLANFIDFGNLLPVAAFGTALGLIAYFRDSDDEKKKEELINEIKSNSNMEGDNDGI
ncbi:PTS N-acetylgalactosamine transporter subunit IIC [Peptostreptococcaceae bacterium OttesenSCG-928-C18]|nr:PTS N-acetylgalactosamine transporter subunit IIC [Peptostreptococcaceae bacterium OttesenSCG-928-C18]